MKNAKKLWKELEDVPINENEEIDIDWKHFNKGTPINDIWHWLEEDFNISIAKDLMYL